NQRKKKTGHAAVELWTLDDFQCHLSLTKNSLLDVTDALPGTTKNNPPCTTENDSPRMTKNGWPKYNRDKSCGDSSA
ncbi:hypothetical protein BG015_000646, partial [Linnemannia schmuckeri]